jgi:broad specificity phosphatase PhoE
LIELTQVKMISFDFRKHDPILSPLGIQQAKRLAERLQQSNIKHIFSSPYIRCLQTANEVADLLNLQIK